MTTDRLAALLHDLAIDVRGSCDHSMYDIHGDGRPGYEKSCVLDAEWLAERGVTVAAQPDKCRAPLKWEEIAVCSVHGIRCDHE